LARPAPDSPGRVHRGVSGRAFACVWLGSTPSPRPRSVPPAGDPVGSCRVGQATGIRTGLDRVRPSPLPVRCLAFWASSDERQALGARRRDVTTSRRHRSAGRREQPSPRSSDTPRCCWPAGRRACRVRYGGRADVGWPCAGRGCGGTGNRFDGAGLGVTKSVTKRPRQAPPLARPCIYSARPAHGQPTSARPP